MTLDTAEIDLSKSFIEGMGYVALSRLKSLDGLKLIGINEIALRVNISVLASDKDFKQISTQVMEDFNKVSPFERQNKQKEFLNSLLSLVQEATPNRKNENNKNNKNNRNRNRNLAKNFSTLEETKNLVLAKKSIKEIAELRALTESTILTHLEKLIIDNKNKEGIDIQYLEPSKVRFQKIKTAFEQTGDWKLSPVREILGDDFSYQELRLTRLAINMKLKSINSK